MCQFSNFAKDRLMKLEMLTISNQINPVSDLVISRNKEGYSSTETL